MFTRDRLLIVPDPFRSSQRPTALVATEELRREERERVTARRECFKKKLHCVQERDDCVGDGKCELLRKDCGNSWYDDERLEKKEERKTKTRGGGRSAH
jgi:hypothetical protein